MTPASGPPPLAAVLWESANSHPQSDTRAHHPKLPDTRFSHAPESCPRRTRRAPKSPQSCLRDASEASPRVGTRLKVGDVAPLSRWDREVLDTGTKRRRSEECAHGPDVGDDGSLQALPPASEPYRSPTPTPRAIALLPARSPLPPPSLRGSAIVAVQSRAFDDGLPQRAQSRTDNQLRLDVPPPKRLDLTPSNPQESTDKQAQPWSDVLRHVVRAYLVRIFGVLSRHRRPSSEKFGRRWPQTGRSLLTPPLAKCFAQTPSPGRLGHIWLEI